MVDELQRAVTVAEIMQSHCLSEHVVAHTPHLHSVWGEKLATVHEASSFKGYWVVSLVHDEHANDTLISINDEVATELVHVFLALHELLFVEAIQVAVLRSHHDWDLADANVDFLGVLVVDAATQRGVEGRLVS